MLVLLKKPCVAVLSLFDKLLMIKRKCWYCVCHFVTFDLFYLSDSVSGSNRSVGSGPGGCGCNHDRYLLLLELLLKMC